MSTSSYFIKIAPYLNIDACPCNKNLQFGICTGLSEFSVLFIHHKMSIFPACEALIFLWKLPLANLSARILSHSNELSYNGPKFTAGKLLVDSPSSFKISNSSCNTS